MTERKEDKVGEVHVPWGQLVLCGYLPYWMRDEG